MFFPVALLLPPILHDCLPLLAAAMPPHVVTLMSPIYAMSMPFSLIITPRGTASLSRVLADFRCAFRRQRRRSICLPDYYVAAALS